MKFRSWFLPKTWLLKPYSADFCCKFPIFHLSSLWGCGSISISHEESEVQVARWKKIRGRMVRVGEGMQWWSDQRMWIFDDWVIWDFMDLVLSLFEWPANDSFKPDYGTSTCSTCWSFDSWGKFGEKKSLGLTFIICSSPPDMVKGLSHRPSPYFLIWRFPKILELEMDDLQWKILLKWMI